LKLENEEYDLMKKQINFVKGWIKSKDYEKTKDDVKKDFKEVNRERELV
jgi:hypothetical protein